MQMLTSDSPDFPSGPPVAAPAAPSAPPRAPDPPSPPPRAPDGFGPTPDPSRSGALWVGATGVSLMLAAAAVLTAVRWDDIAQSAKLGGLVAITLAMLALGRRLRSTIPMTAQAIFHLGAGLVPFDMAAVAILAGWSWQRTLLLTALTAVGSWYGLERVEPSKVLKWAAHMAVVVAAAGVAAVSPLSAPLVLAGAAFAALAARQSTMASFWAIVAGFTPLTALLEWPVRIADANTDLGFTLNDRWQLMAAGVISLGVAVFEATRNRSLELAWTAVAIVASTAIVGFGQFATGEGGVWVGLGLGFVAIELLAFATKRDELWKQVTERVAVVAESAAGGFTCWFGLYVLFGPSFTPLPSSTLLVTAGGLLALGWLTADRRRVAESVDWMSGLLLGSNWIPTTFLFPAAVLTATAAVTSAPGVFAIVLLALGAWMIGTRRLLGSHLGLVLALAAAIAVIASPAHVVVGTGIGAALLMTVAARMRVTEARYRTWPAEYERVLGEGSLQQVGSIALAAAASLFWMATIDGLADFVGYSWAIPLLMAGFWALAWAIEMPSHRALSIEAAWVGRGAALLSLLVIGEVTDFAGLAMVGVVFGAALVDYWGSTDRRFLGLGGAVIGLVGVPLAGLTGIGFAAAGVAMTIAGFVTVGLLLALPKDWELPLGALAGVLSVLGFALAATEAQALTIAVMMVGSTVALIGAALRDGDVGIAGGIAIGIGFWLQLALWEVTWLEPYLVFPAIAALAVGRRAMQNGASSWVAYAPTILAFAGVAEIDRITGGNGWHGVIAGAVGVVAVISGGYRRLAGPLVAGTAVLATVVGYESLGPAALMPTWGWLAIGGTVLLGAAIAMERADTSPIETGQRLRHVIETQFQ